MSIRQWPSLCNPLEVPWEANSVVISLVNSRGLIYLRVVFSQTKNFSVIAFTDANMYAISMTQRNVLKATVPDRMVWLSKPACVIAVVRLSKAQHIKRRLSGTLPKCRPPAHGMFVDRRTIYSYFTSNANRWVPGRMFSSIKYEHFAPVSSNQKHIFTMFDDVRCGQ